MARAPLAADPPPPPASPPAEPPARLLPLGDAAYTLEFGAAIDPAIHARVVGAAAALNAARGAEPLLDGLTDVVPTFRSVTVHFDPDRTEADALGRWLLALAAQDQRQAVAGRAWRLPVCFDEEFGPDLPRLCAATGLGREAAIARLAQVRFRVYMLGFQPGFPYMGGLPDDLALPRLASPRQKVPARSAAIAGVMGAIYPWDSPGGWNLLGRTPVALWDATRADQPAMLAAGDTVSWAPVDRATHDRLLAEVARGLPREHFLAEAAA